MHNTHYIHYRFSKQRAHDCAMQAGAVAFLAKPFEEGMLINSIETALARSAGQRQRSDQKAAC
jgi:FixJ family two-component response regulator